MVKPNYYPQYAESSIYTGKGVEEDLCEDRCPEAFAEDASGHQSHHGRVERPMHQCVLSVQGGCAEIAEEELFELSHDSNSGFS